jgi:ABC-type lipoprotein release transport system permease subunit
LTHGRPSSLLSDLGSDLRYGVAFATVAAILIVTGVAATAIPAQRALRVDPAAIMKEDA